MSNQARQRNCRGRLDFMDFQNSTLNHFVHAPSPRQWLRLTFAKNMYFIRYQRLKEKLKTRTLSDREALPYLILFAALAAAVYLFPTTEGSNIWDWIGGGLSVVLAIGGVIYAYSQNGGAQGIDLIQKYVVIGWVVAVRCILIFIPCVIALYIIGETLGLINDETTWFDTLIIFVFEAILYQRIGRHIADTK